MTAPLPPARGANSPSDLEAMRQEEQVGALVMAARNALRKEERERGRDLLRQALVLGPRDVSALELLGDIYMEEGDTEKAINLFTKALQVHPRHLAFEEKLALCLLDQAQMESDKAERDLVLQNGSLDRKDDLVPSKAATLSLMLPGAGQYYNDESEKSIVFAVVALVSCLAWFYPLGAAIVALPKPAIWPGALVIVNESYATLSGGSQVWVWLMLGVWIGDYAYSMVDAYRCALAHNVNRRKRLGF